MVSMLLEVLLDCGIAILSFDYCSQSDDCLYDEGD